MDLKDFYARMRKIENEIREECVVVVSRATGDGGRAGVRSEVPRAIAARMVAEQKAELADEESAAEYRARIERGWRS